jgi:glycine betaine/proline transport system substrate-binding protein
MVRPSSAAYAAAMADAMGRFRNGEPVLFYTWTPSWVIGTLKPGEDVVWIEVPFSTLPGTQEKFEADTTVKNVAGCVDDPCEMGWPANDIRPVANSQFLEDNPAAKRLLEVMRIPLEDIAAQNAKMFNGEDSEEDLKRHANEWITTNRDQFDTWLGEARAAVQ